ncbi:MAG: hypothetical protein ABSD08_00715 [Xanthobacteraceae bacterium]
MPERPTTIFSIVLVLLGLPTCFAKEKESSAPEEEVRLLHVLE